MYEIRQNYPESGDFHGFLSVSRVIWKASSIISSNFPLPFSQIVPKLKVGPCHSSKTIIKLIKFAGMGFLLMERGATPTCKHQLCKKNLDGIQDAHPPKDADGKMCSKKWMLGLYFRSLKKKIILKNRIQGCFFFFPFIFFPSCPNYPICSKQKSCNLRHFIYSGMFTAPQRNSGVGVKWCWWLRVCGGERGASCWEKNN